jgi:hypothetical protein
VNEHDLAALKTTLYEEIKKCRDKGLRQSSSLFKGNRRGQPHDLSVRNRDQLGISSPRQQSADPFSRRNARHGIPYPAHNTSNLKSQDRGGPGRGRILAGTLHNVGSIDTSCIHFNQHLIIPTVWLGNIRNNQIFVG